MKKKLKVAVVGATGAVGRVLLPILEERRFPVGELLPFASPRSLGRKLAFAGAEAACRALEPGCFKGVDLAFFDASDEVSRRWVPEAVEAGAWVVDNSGAFRMEEGIPLVVPEVNGARLAEALRGRLVAGPNCTTAQLVVALKPLADRFGLRRVIVSSYQSVSGAGTEAMRELATQTREALDGRALSAPKALAKPIAFNCIPHIGRFGEDGYTSEESKVMAETRKILGLPDLRITATAVRVPTLACHGESVSVELDRECDPAEARAALAAQEGLTLVDDPGTAIYPLGLDCHGKDAVFVGRVRRDPSVEPGRGGLNLWIVSDNLRKGAALNAVQIGEILLEKM